EHDTPKDPRYGEDYHDRHQSAQRRLERRTGQQRTIDPEYPGEERQRAPTKQERQERQRIHTSGDQRQSPYRAEHPPAVAHGQNARQQLFPQYSAVLERGRQETIPGPA